VDYENIEIRDGGYYVAGTRVSLASIIYAFREGSSPETIRENFSTLTLGQVYSAIAFYLNHPDESDAYLSELKTKWDDFEKQGQAPGPELQQRLDTARRRLLASRR
jgi:uncharacterized protein (DUF433 family)